MTAYMFNSTPHWLQAPVNCPRMWRVWLNDRGSLTRRLQERSEGNFSVTVLRQAWGKPRRDEAMALGQSTSQYALIREVILYGHDQPWVFARSVVPLNALHGKLRFLHTLGNRPLGELLFQNPDIQRGSIQFAQWPPALLPVNLRNTHPPSVHGSALWARYSIFHHQNSKLLVSEVFLPQLLTNNKYDAHITNHSAEQRCFS